MLPVVDKDIAPAALRFDPIFKLPLLYIVKLAKFDDDDRVVVPEFETAAPPVVLIVNAAVDVSIGFDVVPTAPETEPRFTEVEPDTTPVLS